MAKNNVVDDEYEYQEKLVRCGACGFLRGITLDDCTKCGKGREVAQELLDQYQWLNDADGIDRAKNQQLGKCTYCHQDYWSSIDDSDKVLLPCTNCGASESKQLSINFESNSVAEDDREAEANTQAYHSAMEARGPDWSRAGMERYRQEMAVEERANRFSWFRIWHVFVFVAVVALVLLIIWAIKKDNERIPVDATVQSFYWKLEVPIEKFHCETKTTLLSQKPGDAVLIRQWDDTKDGDVPTGRMIDDTSKPIECKWEDLKNGTRRRKKGPCYEQKEETKPGKVTKTYATWKREWWDWERTPSEEGYDRNPRWPKVWLAKDERPTRGSLESGDETYQVVFIGDNGVQYPKSFPLQEWVNFNEGIEYVIIVTGWGRVVEIRKKDTPNYK